MFCLNDITASPSLQELDPELAFEASAAGESRSGARDSLANLNQGQGKELLDAYLAHPDSYRRNALALHYGPCAQVVARQIYRAMTADSRRQLELADVEQSAHQLLFGLLEKFDATLGIPLSAFLIRRLRFALIDEYRRMGLMVRGGRSAERRPRLVPFERPGKHRGDAERTLLVVDKDPGPVEQLMAREVRKSLLRKLPREHRLFAVYRFMRGLQLWQVAKRLHMTCEQATRLQAECLSQLRKALGIKEPPKPPTAARRRVPAKQAVAAAEAPARVMRIRPATPALTIGRSEPAALPAQLPREKEFRRWFLLRLPWAYRKLIAYRYLRGRDIDWTASKLGICPNKARVLDRQARPLMMKVIEAYQSEGLEMVA